MRSSMSQRELTREKYIEELKQRAHYEIVSFKAGLSASCGMVSWTNRNTGCDVISLVTTSRPFLHGSMKDLQLKPEKAASVKPSPSESGASVYSKALHPGSDHNSKERALMNKILHEERDKFFKRLKTARIARSVYETTAAVAIQAIVRGYLTRLHLPNIKMTCLTLKDLRLRLRTVVSASSEYVVPTLGRYRAQYKKVRRQAALIIQMMFRRFLSKSFLLRRKEEYRLNYTNKMIVRIQNAGRKYNAKKRVNVVRERKLVALRLKAILKMQTFVRRLLATRRVQKRRLAFRWLAARMIQSFYRHVISKRKAHVKRLGMAQRLRQRGALAMQQVARSYVSKLRTGRIRQRKNFLKRYVPAMKIQKIIRGFISRRRVSKLRISKQKDIEAAALQRKTEMEAKAAEEAIALMEESDIFIQTRKGHATEVEDIFTGLMSDEPHEVTEVDDFGDTILLIAASLGHMEIVRKCLLWGFDINFRNELTGSSAVAVAAQHKHFDIVQYLLNPPLPMSSSSKNGVKAESAPRLVWSADDVAIVLNSVACHSNNVSLMSTLIEILGHAALETKHTDSGETAFHGAFRGGNVDMAKLLLKHATPETYSIRDEAGKTVYHCASESSVDLWHLLMETDPAFSAAPEESKEGLLLSMLRDKEQNGKSCLLLAALYGQEGVLRMANKLESIASSAENAHQVEDAEIGWSPSDIEAAIKTSGDGKVDCIKYLIEAGYDPSWANDDTGVTIVMTACQHGRLEVIDVLMQSGTSFAQTDAQGRTAFHYACMCTSENVLSYILSHSAALKCDAKGSSLATPSKNGITPIHIAAEFGCDLSVDLLAQDGIAAAINMATSDGMTPLMIAAAKNKTDLLGRLLVLDADPKLSDMNGHNALWHLLQSTSGDKVAASVRLGVTSAGLELVRAGCPIVSTSNRSVDKWRERKFAIAANKVKREDMDCIELLAADKNTTFFRSLAKTIDPEACWSAVLTAIVFDTSDTSLYNALMAGGADEIMMKLKDAKYLSSNGGPAPAADSKVPRIMDILYKGYTLHGWVIILDNLGLLMKLLDKYPLSNNTLDIYGNTAFHIAARYSSVDMVDAILSNCKVLVETPNKKGDTALMEGMTGGYLKTLIKIAKVVAEPRRGLSKRWDAWLLAIARSKERNEKNLQTGQIQHDDETVCPMAPDPDYLFWYEYNNSSNNRVTTTR